MGRMPSPKKIPWVKGNGQRKDLTTFGVPFPVDGLSSEEVDVLCELQQSVGAITPIFALQNDPRTFAVLGALKQLEAQVPDSQKQAIQNYITQFEIMGGPFDSAGDSYILQVDHSTIPSNHPIMAFRDFIFDGKKAPKGRGFYSEDLGKKQFNQLGSGKNIVNSTVMRRNGKLEVVLNEERFDREVAPVIHHLRRAALKTGDENLRKYLLAQVTHLEFGSESTKTKADLAWLENSGKVDFIFSTGLETYEDRAFGVRGTAQGMVGILDPSYDETLRTHLRLLPQWERTAPWKHRKEANPPRIRPISVLNESGSYYMFPMIVSAESLPNEKVFTDKHGGVNHLLINVTKARSKSPAVAAMRSEFMAKDELKKYGGLMPDIGMTMILDHEIGHTTSDKTIKEDPNKFWGKNYSLLEEARAELFSMWALKSLVDERAISKDQEVAGYYSMLIGCIAGLQMPAIDHAGSRNMMFHYFIKTGAVKEVTEDSKTKYVVDEIKMRGSVEKMLGEIADIEGTGNRRAFDKFRSEYLSDQKREYFAGRMKEFPLGLGPIFGTLQHDGKIIYPGSFREQPRIQLLEQMAEAA